MDICRDIIARTDELASERVFWEQQWLELADYCLPSQSRAMRIGADRGRYGAMNSLMDIPSTRDASRKRYDSTAISAIDRLSAGMESLVAPQSEKWAELAPTDPLAPEPTDPEAKWYERLRDYQFAIRYTPMSGFGNANQKYIRSIVTFGTGVMFVQEAFGKHGKTQRELPVTYQHIPLSQALIGCDSECNPDTVHRRFARTARQVVQKFGDKASQKTRDMANDSKRCDQMIDLIHAVAPRMELGSRAGGDVRNAPWASYYLEVEGAHLIGESGFYEFPFAVGYWVQTDESPYGESPALAALDDIRGLNVTRKSVLTAWQTAVRPPMAVADDGVMNRANLNPGAINYGAVDANGRLKIQPITSTTNPSLGKDVIEDGRNTVKELLYNNLFQILVQNPEMTAHEAMLRAAEKGDLLGPNGVKIQQGYSTVSDREIGIFERKGAFRPGAPLEPPKSIRGRSFGARFTSTLDRLRESKDAAGIMQTYQAAGQIASLRQSPEILDNLDDDVNLKLLARINGMPLKGLKNIDDVVAMRKARLQAQQTQMAASLAQQGADAARSAAQGESHATDAAATQKSAGLGGSASQGIGAIGALLSKLRGAGGGGAGGPGGGPMPGAPSIAPGLTTAPLPLPQLSPAAAPAR